ncbi:MAG: TIM44-like domain-containing protein [Alphaproteobacteria bacterium]
MSIVSNLTVAALGLAIVLAPVLAEARAGGGKSMGSRGGRTYQSAPATPTAPASKPIERSVTPAQPTQKPATSPSVAPQNPASPAPLQPSFAQRHPFMTGFLGGFVGAGIAGMLFGHGFGAGLGGFAGGMGLLLQLALIGGLLYLGYRLLRGRQEPAYAGGAASADGRGEGTVRRIYEPAHLARGNGADPSPMQRAYEPAQLGGPSSAGEGAPELKKQDFDEFERLLGAVQAGWTAGDVAALRRVVTPEMLSYFSEQLAANVSRGVENKVEEVKLLQGDLSECWSEDETDYASVAMRWSARDYTLDTASGRVVEGDRERASEASEVWTFMRSRGGRWLLSAIQQV